MIVADSAAMGGERVKILDFGIAKLLPAPMSGSNNGASTLSLETQSGAIVGTVGYMAPEQVKGQTADARSDLFALGVLLYTSLAGELPILGRGGAPPRRIPSEPALPPELQSRPLPIYLKPIRRLMG